MKHSFALVSIFGFVSLAVFGFLGMSYAMNEGHVACVASAAQNLSCPLETSQIGFVSFHLNALKNFSTAVFSDGLLFLTVALFLAIELCLIFKFKFLPNLFLKPCRVFYEENPDSQIRRKFFRWLSLHEASPNSFL